ncbi:hypothetical protein [Halarchaeum sp. P4]|uniref:hypothetical protein n=1 Tax=Halarchaeum sp. P4 TaxID=3421639 RepID=UPI003EB83154
MTRLARFIEWLDGRYLALLVVSGAVVLGAGAGFVVPTDTQDAAPVTTTAPPTPPVESGPNPQNASVSVSIAAPSSVTNANGTVETVSLPLSGSASWAGSVERARVTVWSWTPQSEWQPVANATATPTGGSLDVASVVGKSIQVANASEFSNPADETTVERRGYVAVSVQVFADGERVGTTARTRAYTLSVTNDADGSSSASMTPVGVHYDTANSTSTNDSGRPRLVIVGNANNVSGFGATGVAPGMNGESRVTLENRGNASGRLVVAASNWTDAENDRIEPERDAGDATASDGELYEGLAVRVAVVENDGVTYLAGSASAFVAADSTTGSDFEFERTLAPGENVTLVTQWRLPRDAGNVVQSDAAGVSFSYALSNTTSATASVRRPVAPVLLSTPGSGTDRKV